MITVTIVIIRTAYAATADLCAPNVAQGQDFPKNPQQTRKYQLEKLF